MFEGKVESIHICPEPEGRMESVAEVKALTDRGLEGDRYFTSTGTFSKKSYPDRNITLIEAEAVEAANAEDGVELDYGEPRRNVVTRGVPLNHLVEKEFTVGEVRLRGIKLCEPCGHLEGLTRRGVKDSLIHRGGLRAEILSDGMIRAGDEIRL
ncbi:MAG: MOSC domain-containing protein [Actinobacteria bacterium]|nr:MOSC domain-containing protein [Actinomycetota bacterium]